MAETPTLNLRYMILRYLVVMILTAALMYVVYRAMAYFFEFEPSTGGNIAIAIVPALDAGQVFVRNMQRLPIKREAWRLSALLFAIHLAFGLALLTLAGVLMGGVDLLSDLFALFSFSGAIWVYAIVLFFYFLATWFFFRSGAKSEIRRVERLAANNENTDNSQRQ